MIIEEMKTINGKEYKFSYSDNGKEIRQIETGLIFTDALDKATSNYTYEEVEDEIKNQFNKKSLI